MSNHSHNTITITGPEAELRKFSAAHPLVCDNDGPGPDFMIKWGAIRQIDATSLHRFGWDVTRATIVTEHDDHPGLTLVLKYYSVTAWSPPVDKIEELSSAYPELRFELENTFGPGEGCWRHYVFVAGRYQGRCPGGWVEGMKWEPCPDNDTERGGDAVVVYEHWWQYCEKHKTRWCVGDASPKDETEADRAEQERMFNLLGGVAGIPEESGHGYLSYARAAYVDADMESDRRYWRATVRDRQRQLEQTPEGRAMLELGEEVAKAKKLAERAAEEAERAKWAVAVANDGDEFPF